MALGEGTERNGELVRRMLRLGGGRMTHKSLRAGRGPLRWGSSSSASHLQVSPAALALM